MDTTVLVVISFGLLVFAAHMFAGLFRSKLIPDVLLLIVIGLLVGPIFGIVDKSFFGDLGGVFASITLVIILFEGGSNLKFSVLHSALKGTMSLTNISFLVTAFVCGLCTMVIFDFDPVRAFMLGAFLGGTASAIVIPMVSVLRMDQKSKTILILESAISDVLCVVVALALIETFKLGEFKAANLIFKVLSGFFVSAIIGLLGGLIWAALLNWIRNLQNSIFTTPAFVFLVYGLTEIMGLSGIIASLMFGIALANTDLVPERPLLRIAKLRLQSINDTERTFFAEIVFLLKTFFFVYLGIHIILTDVYSLLVGLFLTILIYVIRVSIVRLSVSKTIPISDRVIMSMMVPKGLAAAVLASLPAQMGIPGGDLIQNITFATVLFSIIFNSVLIMGSKRSKGLVNFYESLLN
jgi:NhaP-type Na+/H+ or K+/H+ antiporter